jgi:hypothetical protein
MENKIVNLEVKGNFDELLKDVKKLNAGLEESTKEIKKVEKNTESAEKSSKSLAEGFKATGLAIKAMGIGLLISAFSTLKDVFMSNQKVADTFGAVIGTMTNIFTQMVNILVSVVEKVSKSSNGFSALGKVISGLITISLTPLKLAFYGIGLAIDEAKLAWEESFFGDGNPKVIADLNKRITVTKENIVQVGKDALNAGKKVVTNFVGAVKEVSAVVEGTIDGVSKISVKAAYEQSKANIQLQNNAKLAAAEQGRLVEQYDRQAEKLRQVRDNDLLSIDDRIKANDKLKGVLEKQQAAMLAQADLQVAAARATYAMNKSIENQAAVTDALANKEGVLAQVEGLRSENIANNISLQKEKIALGQSEVEGLNALAIEQKKFNETLETDELKKLENQRLNLEEEKRIELERLQLKIDSSALGTQARVDAELEYATKKQEIDNALITNNKATEDKITADKKAAEDARRNINSIAIQSAQGLVGILAGLGEKNKKLQKAALIANGALSIAEIINNTNVGSAKEVATKGIFGLSTSAVLYAKMAISIGSVIAATAKGLGALGGGSAPSAGGGGEGGGGGTAPAAPAFNVVGASSTNQLAQTIGNQQQQPIKAYVVSNDVTTAQSLDRNIISSASIG